MLNPLSAIVGKSLNGKAVEHLVRLPSLVVVGNIEDAYRLRTLLNPDKYSVVHSPRIFEARHQHTYTMKVKGGGRFQVYFIQRSQVQSNLANLFYEQDSAADVRRALSSLEERIAESSAVRAEGMARLEEAARRISQKDYMQNSGQVMELVRTILLTQFEQPEHFIREAVQNADGAGEDKGRNRIDVYLDTARKTVKVEDQGRGMSRDVMDKFFFNLYASMNEALQHAAGKFGIGAVSFFGLGHEYVRVDSKPDDGVGGLVEVDANLMRGNFRPTKRQKGTAVEIKLSEKSPVDFGKVVEILERDCRYIETPLYLHLNGETMQLNFPLHQPNSADTVTFEEKNIEGHVRRVEGKGTLDLLDHRIRLKSVQTTGYSGAVNCSGLETIFSRDTVVDNPVLSEVLRIVELKAKELRPSKASLDIMTLEQRLALYQQFLRSTLFSQNGSADASWLENNLAALEEMRSSRGNEIEEATVHLTNKIFFPAQAIMAAGISLAKKARGRNQTVRESLSEIRKSNRLTNLTTFIVSAGSIGAGVSLSALLSESHPLLSKLSMFGSFLPMYPVTAAQIVAISKYTQENSVVNVAYRNLSGNEALKAGFAQKAPFLAKAFGTALLASVLAYGGFVGVGKAVNPNLSQLSLEQAGPAIVEPRGKTYDGVYFLGNKDLATILANLKGDQSGYRRTDTSNLLELVNGIPVWKDAAPYDELQVKGIKVALPNELSGISAQDSFEGRIRAVSDYIQANFEYGTVPKKVGKKYADKIAATVAEKMAVCTGGNTLAAIYLSELGVNQVRAATGTLEGNPHMWLEIKEGANWVTQDFTPSVMNLELSQAVSSIKRKSASGPSLESYAVLQGNTHTPAGLDWSKLFTAIGIAGAGLVGYSAFRAKRDKLGRRQDNLSPEQEAVLEAVRDSVKGNLGIVDVYFAKGLKPKDRRFYVGEGKIVLNPYRLCINPGIVGLAYAINVMRSPEIASKIGGRISGSLTQEK